MSLPTPPQRLCVIELAKEDTKFSAGHFTIFSATERERLHGHNFSVSLSLQAEVGENGMCFDYGLYKKQLRFLCDQWDEYFILPTQSPHLQIEESAEHVHALFNNERIPFLRSDVLLLPIVNATLEELSRLMLSYLTQDAPLLERQGVWGMSVSVSSGPGQSARSEWTRPT